MSVQHVEVIVEEPSAEAALQSLLPTLLGEVSFIVHAHQGKAELLKRLPDRLRGYALRRKNDPWFRDHCRVVVLVDRDDDDCIELKKKLEKFAADAGLMSRRSSKARPYVIATRVAIEELEAWFFGDWQAVLAAYPKVDPHVPSQAKHRSCDEIKGGTWEAFERVLQSSGYFSSGLRKIEVARTVAAHMHASRNTSPSFQRFAAVLAEMRV